MIGLYEYDDALFDKMNLPAGINKIEFIDAFLLKYGECPVIYPNWGTMQFALGVWSKKWYRSIERIIRALTEEYNPLHNFDRHEIYTDTEEKEGNIKGTENATDKVTGSTNNTSNGTVTNTSKTDENISQEDDNETGTNGSTIDDVSAYNDSDYSPDKKQTVSETVTLSGSRDTDRTMTVKDEQKSSAAGSQTSTQNATRTGSTSTDTSEDRTLKHEGHLFGNIGVTESTTMALHEIELRTHNNIIDVVADMLYKEVCIFVY